MLREADFLILGFLKPNDTKHTTLGQCFSTEGLQTTFFFKKWLSEGSINIIALKFLKSEKG